MGDVVGVGWGRAEVAHGVGLSGHAGVVVFSAFGRDAVGPVLRSGAAPFGHHRAPRAAIVLWRVSFRCRHPAGSRAQVGKQQRAARGGDIGMSRRRGQNQRPVGQLLMDATPKRFSPNDDTDYAKYTSQSSGAGTSRSAAWVPIMRRTVSGCWLSSDKGAFAPRPSSCYIGNIDGYVWDSPLA